jgi:hypothetical protein
MVPYEERGARTEEQSARFEYPLNTAELRENGAGIEFRRAWPTTPGDDEGTLADYRGRRHDLLRLLQWRVRWGTVAQWARGERLMPLWARDAIAGELERRAARDLEIARRIRALPEPKGKARRNWRASNNRE